MTASVLPGAEPFFADGGTAAALVLHGFTGSPYSMRPLAEALADRGISVELPLLPGHGTSVEDMIDTRWDDWSAAADKAFTELAARSSKVAVVGLSMGGTLAAWLAVHRPEVDGLVLVNPLLDPPRAEARQALADLIAAGQATIEGIGSDIALEGVEERAYLETPLAPALSLFDAVAELAPSLSDIRCPVLLLSSRQDHVVDPASGDLLVSACSGPCERVWLDRSYHVATLDHDRDEVVARTVDFVSRVTAT